MESYNSAATELLQILLPQEAHICQQKLICSIDNLRRFCIAKGLEVTDLSKDDIRDEFSYDILTWVVDGFEPAISSYKRKTKLRFVITEKHKRILCDLISYYGVSDDLKGKILVRVSPEYLVKKVINANFG
jgi:hypothetical protein